MTSDDLYRAVLDGTPYRVRGLVGFGTNLVLSHADVQRGREALGALEFFVLADLFVTPTAQYADVVLPVSTCWENEALRVGFEVSADAEALVQWRRRVVEPLGEARSDTWIVFALARRLGLGSRFWDGDVDAAYRHLLAPSGLSLDELRRSPAGIRVPRPVRYRKYAECDPGGATGFATPTRKVELYSEVFLAHGYPPLPEYVEPLVSPVSRPDLAARWPLVLTSAKLPQFCHSQHRALPSLRRRVRDPEVEVHPRTAAERGIADGQWVALESPDGRIRVRARFNDSLHPGVVVGQHGWWQSCPELDARGHDPYDPEGANLNAVIGNAAIDPISGSVPHRSYLCDLRPVG